MKILHFKLRFKRLGKLCRGKQLRGIDAIMKYLELQDISTVQDWIIGYDFPARKENGIYVAFVFDIKKWRSAHPDVQETPRADFAVIQYRTIKKKWGLEEVQRRFFKL